MRTRQMGPLLVALLLVAACGQAASPPVARSSPETTLVPTPLAGESPTPTEDTTASGARAIIACRSVDVVSVSPNSPVVSGSPVTVTAQTFGCPYPLYRFQLISLATGVGLVVQDWGGSDTWTWDTSGQPVDRYAIQVEAHGAGESQFQVDATARVEVDLVHAAPSGSPVAGKCASVAVTVSPATSPVSAGTLVIATARASGCSSAEYRFLLVELGSGVGVVMQDWGSSNTWSWDTTGQQADRYAVRADARAYGVASANPDATAQVEVDVTH